MATIGTNYPTLLEVSKNFGEDGRPLPLAELLTQMNPILDDIPWQEANSTGGHRIAVRSGYPTATWRKLNGGVQPSKSTYADVTESMGMLTELGIVDKALAELAPNVNEFRLRENVGHIESMNQGFAEALIYGDTDTNPEQYLGLTPRFNDLSGPENAAQIIDAGGNDTDLCSIWLVGWGDNGAYGIYPKGSQAGLIHKDYGEQLVTAADGSGGQYPGLRDWFEWRGGIAVKDWRNIVRVANIDVSNMTKDAATGADLIDLMVQAIEQINAPDGLNLAFYVPRVVRSFLRRQITNKKNVWLSMDEVAGRKALMFDSIPVRRVDKLLLTESRVV
jgi:hypothetical protein